jgi:hypothetical protein
MVNVVVVVVGNKDKKLDAGTVVDGDWETGD